MTILTPENATKMLAGLPIRKATRIDRGIFMTLYGQGGSGKTTLSAELYKVGKTLLIDAEGGSDVLSDLEHESNLDIIDVKSYREFSSICDSLTRDLQGYENIIVDNLCEIIDLCEIHLGIIGNDSHDLSKYKLMTREIMRRIRAFRELTRTRGINVIICCWDADEKDDRGVLKKDLAFTPALRKEYPGICTIIGHIKVLNNPEIRLLDFAPSPKSVSKFKRSRNAAAQAIPFEIYYSLKNLPLADIVSTIKAEGDWPEKKYPKLIKE